jgi:hypothetical protein
VLPADWGGAAWLLFETVPDATPWGELHQHRLVGTILAVIAIDCKSGKTRRKQLIHSF